MVLKEAQTFRVYNPSSVWRKTVFSTLKKGYIPETSVFLSKPFLTLFDIIFLFISSYAEMSQARGSGVLSETD